MQVFTTYYISSGALNAMYTLRKSIDGKYPQDYYICNLSTDAEKAQQKAEDYFDRITKGAGETDTIKLYSGADFELNGRSGKLSVINTRRIEQVERGIMPFGKREGDVLAEMPRSTVLWWADNYKELTDDHNSNGNSMVFNAVCAACLGIAMELGYIAQRQKIRDDQLEQDMKSQHFGEIKKRYTFEGVVGFCISLGMSEPFGYYDVPEERFMTQIRVGDDILMYFGKQLAEKGEQIKFKGTVKEHSEHKGVKQTVINRPALI